MATREAAAPGDIEDCDVLVVGGGPAGSTISALLAEQGWRVTLLEKERHPRFHIGESLLPLNLPIFARLGVLDQVDAIGIRKPGADFNSMLEVGGQHQFHFAFALDENHPYAYEVRRSELDELLLRNSAAKGTRVLEDVRVTRVDVPPGGDPSASAVDGAGRTLTCRCRFLVDASGRDALLARHLDLKRKSTRHASAAIFGHFANVERREGEFEGNISVYWFEHGWFWLIPLRDGSMSVGAVCRPTYLKQRRNSLQEFLLQTIALGHPEMRHRLRNATLIDDMVRATGNYSYHSTRMRGERYILVGDAFAFVDPIFSSGVYLGMNSGVLGADAIDAWLRGDPTAAGKFRHFDRTVRHGVRTFSWFIERFNTPAMRHLLLHPGNPFRVQSAVISLLAGDVFRNIGTRSRFLFFRALFYLFSLRHARESIRLWWLRVREPGVAFTGGTTPVDPA